MVICRIKSNWLALLFTTVQEVLDPPPSNLHKYTPLALYLLTLESSDLCYLEAHEKVV